MSDRRDTVTIDNDPQPTAVDILDTAVVSSIARAEIDVLIQTARAYPRSIALAQKRIIDLATMDEESAAECMYSLPRGGKPVEGPSIRYAELVAQSWGNCRIAARTTIVDRANRFVEAEAIFLDAETNMALRITSRRPISDKYGKIYKDDMINVTAMAAQSIARRNVTLAGVPRNVWRKGYEASRQVVMGDMQTLTVRRDAAIKSFSRFGLTEQEVLALMGANGIEDIDQQAMIPLRGMYSGLMSGEVTVEALRREINPEPERVTAVTAAMAAPAAFASEVRATPKPRAKRKADKAAVEPAVKPMAEQPARGGLAADIPPTHDLLDPLREQHDAGVERLRSEFSAAEDMTTIATILHDHAAAIAALPPARSAVVNELKDQAIARISSVALAE